MKDTSGVDAEFLSFINARSGDDPAFVMNWYSRLMAFEFRDSVQLRKFNTSISVPSAGVWFHVAVSWSSVDNVIHVFQDFNQIITASLPNVRIYLLWAPPYFP